MKLGLVKYPVARYHAKTDPNNITLLLSKSTKEDANKLVAGVVPRRMQTQDRGQHYNLETDVTIIIGRLSVCGVVYCIRVCGRGPRR